MKKFDNFGVISMPIYLIIAIIVSTIIIGLFSLSIYNMINQSKKDIAIKEIEKIVSEAENMFEYADEDTELTISVNFPDSLSFVVFGSLPRNATLCPKNFILDEKTSNNYYYVMSDGSIKSFSSHVRFCGFEIDNISVLHYGSYDLVLKLEKVGEHSYVKIYNK